MSRQTLVDVYELTPMQQGMLFHRLVAPGEGFYVEQTVLTLTGRVDREAFWRAWQVVVDRHDALRTAFRWEQIAKPVQAVRARATLPRQEYDWREHSPERQPHLLDDLLRDERHQGFDLEVGPLMRVALCQLADERFQLALRLSHLVVDGWSVGLMFSDFTTAYRAYARGEEPVLAPAGRFRDYVAWWKRQDTAAVEPFWRRYLAGFQPGVPLALQQTATDPRHSYDWVDLGLDDLAPSLREWSASRRLTLNTLVQGAWTLVLGRATGAVDVVAGLTFAHRPPDVPAVESIVGCMVGTVPVRSSIAPDRPVLDWLRQLQDDIMTTRDNATAGLNEIQRWGGIPAGSQLVESLVAFQNMPLPGFTLAEEGLSLDGYDMFTRPHTTFILLALPGDHLPLRLIFDRRRVGREQATALLAGVRSVLASIVRAAPARLADVESGTVTGPEAVVAGPEAVVTGPGSAASGRQPATETEAALCALFADLLRLDHVDPGANLVELGLHSLLGTRAANRIRDEWQTPVPLQALFDQPTVEGLATMIEAGGAPDDLGRAARPSIDLLREASLDPQIVGPAQPGWRQVPERILVTGATGYLGSAVLERLLRSTPAQVVCLVRSLDPAEGRRRLREVLAAAGRWAEEFEERIEVLPGNLSQRWLGLEPARFAALAESLDEIYHLGAVANTMPAYRRLRPTNVDGTREVLRLATTARSLPVYHISPAEVTDVDDPERRGRELPVVEPPSYLPNGYIQSKWIADRIVGAAAGRGVPAVVCRAARLVGSPAAGRWKLGDVVGDLVRGCVALGAVPECDLAMPVSTVEHVASGMAALARIPGTAGRCFHLTAACPFTFAVLAEALESRGYPARPVALDRWYAELVRHSRRDPGGRWDLVLSVLGPWVRATTNGWREPLYDTTQASAALDGVVPVPVIDSEFVAACLDHLGAVGYLPLPATASIPR